MILHLPPDSTPLLADAAALVLFLHIGAASVGLGSGAAAMALRKGGRGHRTAGNVFFASMLTMSAIGACVAPFLPAPDWSSSGAGVFTFYLVATGWRTTRRKDGVVGWFEIAAATAALAIAAAFAVLGWTGAHRPGGTIGGQPWEPAVAFGAVAALAAALDMRMIWRGGVSGARRIARHLWRMCVALFIASASFFLGQPQVFPQPLRGSPILIGFAVAPLALMVFWLFRVRFTKRFKPGVARPGAIAGARRDDYGVEANA